MTFLRISLQILVPLGLLGGAAWLSGRIASSAPQPAVAAQVDTRPLVRLASVRAEDITLQVTTNGTVEPYRTVDISAEVGGRIVDTHPMLRAGGFFTKDDVLVTIDDADYALAVEQQKAAVARAELRLLQERAESNAAIRAWKELEGERAPDPLATRAPQIRDAESNFAAAQAQLQKCERDRSRTRIRAPFTGRVRAVTADLGQTVQPGQRLATVFDTTCVEVRLPIPVADAEFLELPLHRPAAPGQGPRVTLSAEFAGERHEWLGRVVRTDGEVDRRTRQLSLVARVEDAYTRNPEDRRPPLFVGTFVQARIEGVRHSGVLVVPGKALRSDNQVLVAVPHLRGFRGGLPVFELTLRQRTVEVLRTEADRVLVRSGLRAGERVCVTTLETATDGMRVRAAPVTADGAR